MWFLRINIDVLCISLFYCNFNWVYPISCFKLQRQCTFKTMSNHPTFSGSMAFILIGIGPFSFINWRTFETCSKWVSKLFSEHISSNYLNNGEKSLLISPPVTLKPKLRECYHECSTELLTGREIHSDTSQPRDITTADSHSLTQRQALHRELTFNKTYKCMMRIASPN